MPDYLTTREVAKLLRLNEKKVYDLVSKGQLPAARVSGKWLFPRHLVESWVESKTVCPSRGLMGNMLDDMLVSQGSDDYLLSKLIQQFLSRSGVPVVSAKVGSLAGVTALVDGKAHLAGCHVGNEQVKKIVNRRGGCYLVNLFQRSQGLIFDRERHPKITGLRDVVEGGLRFANRQEASGTYQLVGRLLADEGLEWDDLETAGTWSTHLELALAVRTGQADCGVGIQIAAKMCGLDFLPIELEPYKLAMPGEFFAHPRMKSFLEFVLGGLEEERGRTEGYQFDTTGRIEIIGTADQTR